MRRHVGQLSIYEHTSDNPTAQSMVTKCSLWQAVGNALHDCNMYFTDTTVASVWRNTIHFYRLSIPVPQDFFFFAASEYTNIQHKLHYEESTFGESFLSRRNTAVVINVLSHSLEFQLPPTVSGENLTATTVLLT